VIKGWRAVVYQHENFLGASLEVTADVTDLAPVPGPCDGTFNDCISSIQVIRRSRPTGSAPQTRCRAARTWLIRNTEARRSLMAA